jgi:nitroimidazol reductase NimA-like FMN-containing flavoprotein (pyridoxamine 5'-phosphate oxidase superfamily)
MNETFTTFTQDFIKNHYIGNLAYVTDNNPGVFTTWYSCLDNKLCFKSRTASDHSKAFAKNPNACFVIYDHAASYPDAHKTGVQIKGAVRQVVEREEMVSVLASYSQKFGEEVMRKNSLEELLAPDTTSTFYVFTPHSIKLVAKEFGIHMDEYEEFVLG